MSLDWNLENIDDWEKKCKHTLDNGEWEVKVITNRIIWATMTVDIGKIKDETVAREFKRRWDFVNQLAGLSTDGITLQDVIDHIGLSTNVVTLSWAGFAKRKIENWKHEWDYNNPVKKEIEPVKSTLTLVPAP